MTVDVLIIGGGNAALCAALMAREAGASVMLLEAAPRESRGGCHFGGPREAAAAMGGEREHRDAGLHAGEKAAGQSRFQRNVGQLVDRRFRNDRAIGEEHDASLSVPFVGKIQRHAGGNALEVG